MPNFAPYFEGGFSVQKLINALTDLLKGIFGYIADSEGWVEEETTTVA